MPTSQEPVNTIPEIAVFSTSSFPVVPPGPVTTLKTPGGKPDSSRILAMAKAGQGASLEGLTTIEDYDQPLEMQLVSHHFLHHRPNI
jgi:hypothetical protein